MRGLPLHWLPVVLALAACSGESSTPSGTEAALDLLRDDRLSAHLEFLAADRLAGRRAGEPGFDAAAAYVAGQFAGLGMVPGGSDGWYQPVPLTRRRLDTDSTRFVLHRAGENIELAYRDDYSMGSGDKVREETSVRGEVVFVGYGVHAPELGYTDYDGIDVDGKLIAYFTGGPSSLPGPERAYYSSTEVRYAEAVRRGAIGAIALRSRLAEKDYPWDRVRRTTGQQPGMAWVDPDTGRAADFFTEIRAYATLSPAAAERLFASAPLSFSEALDAADAARPASTPLGVEASLSLRTDHDRLESPNVIGIVPGSDPRLSGEYVVFTAHLDHSGIGEPLGDSDDRIYNGAYDNAIGVALMLETARAISASPPRRSVMFIALTGEEDGLIGSDYFVHFPTVPIESVVANVNLDMPLFLFPVADLIDFGAAHSTLKEPMTAAARAEGFRLVPDPRPEENVFRRSDQYSFVKRGIPASYLDTGFRSSDPATDGEAVVRDHMTNHYHMPSDDLTRPVDWDSARRFARANARVGLLVANADRRPAWNEGDFFGERFANPR